MTRRKAKIAFLHYTAEPVIGGVENVISDHVRVFNDSGYQVQVIAGRGQDIENECVETRIIPEIDSEHPQNREIAKALETGQVPASFAHLQTAIRDVLLQALGGTDLLIVHNVLSFHFNLPLTAALYSLVTSSLTPPTIAWCHDISRHVNPRSGHEQRFGFPWDLLRTYNSAIRYVAVSKQRQRALAGILGIDPETIKVIPNGVAPEKLLGLSENGRYLINRYDLLEADVILLMPIRITRAKNIEFALEVTSALKNQGLDPRLIVTGPPDPHAAGTRVYFRKLLALRADLALERHVVFLSERTSSGPSLTIGHSDIAEYYGITDIVFIPSHREGFGLPILEAGLLGKAIFTSRIPAVEELGLDTVHLIDAEETAQHVAERIRGWANSDVEHRLRRRIRRDYTWQGIFKRTIEPMIVDCLTPEREHL